MITVITTREGRFLVDTEPDIRPGSQYIVKWGETDTWKFTSTSTIRKPAVFRDERRYTVIIYWIRK